MISNQYSMRIRQPVHSCYQELQIAFTDFKLIIMSPFSKFSVQCKGQGFETESNLPVNQQTEKWSLLMSEVYSVLKWDLSGGTVAVFIDPCPSKLF